MNSDWWRGATLYQIYPRSFADANGDGVGDLAGITAKLPCVAALGVDGIWLSPFFPSPMRDFGHDVSDHLGVGPLFGSTADFDTLLDTARRLGLKVLIDQVWSHTAAEHPRFHESRSDRCKPKADWYVWADARADSSPPNNWQSWMGGPAWRWEPRRRRWFERGADGLWFDTANTYLHSHGLEDNPPPLACARRDRRSHADAAPWQRAVGLSVLMP